MESYFDKHEPCPHCGSRDNLARYSDGHAFCFGCGYREGTRLVNGKVLMTPKERNTALPSDFQRAIPPIPYEWLQKYGLTLEEIWENNIGWSESLELLIFPVFNEMGEVVMWQGRNFRLTSKGIANYRKYLTFGGKEHLHILKSKEEVSTITLCEDAISAIKIARVQDSMPLFGSYVSTKLMGRLAILFKDLVVWLDPDKQGKEYTSIINRGKMYFNSVRCIISEKDPKDYGTFELMSCLKKD